MNNSHKQQTDNENEHENDVAQQRSEQQRSAQGQANAAGTEFIAAHQKLIAGKSDEDALKDMEKTLQLAFAKETRDKKVLLKVRPTITAQQTWTAAADFLEEAMKAESAQQTDEAPPGTLVRELKPRRQKAKKQKV